MTGALTSKTLTEQAAAGQRKTKAAQPAAGTAYTYDAAGRVHTATTADGAVTSYTYTPAGQIATVTQPSGTMTTYSYDPKTGRLAEVDVQAADGSTQKTGYTYDPATGRVTSVYDPAHPADAISYAYDADGHVIEVDYPDGTSTKASYDDNGKLATTTDITGAVTTYTYNAGGTCGPAATDLCQAVQARGGTTLASVSYTYDPMDRVHTITRGNGVTTTIDYTDASQVKTETTTAADGTALRTDGYTYDAHGNVATHTITSALPAPRRQAQPGHGHGHRKHASPPTTTAYRYDAYNRLLSSAVYPGTTATGTPTTTTSYTLDAAGNVTGQDTTTSAGTTHTVNTISPGGELTARTTDGISTGQKFDADGNVTTDLAGDTYTYDPDGQQASVTTPAGVTTSYTYWPDHTRRTATTTAGGVAHVITYHYATTGGIANDTYTGGGPATITASYLTGVNREARTLTTATGNGPGTVQATGPGTGYYLADAHGSVTAMIDDHRTGHRQLRLRRLRPARRRQPRPAAYPGRGPGRQRRRQPVHLRRRLHQPLHRHPVPARPQLRPRPGPVPVRRRRRPVQPLPGLRHQPDHQHRPHRPALRPPVGQRRLHHRSCSSPSASSASSPAAPASPPLAAEGIAEVTASAIVSAAANLVSGATNIAAAATASTSLANEGQRKAPERASYPTSKKKVSTLPPSSSGASPGPPASPPAPPTLAGKGAETAATTTGQLVDHPQPLQQPATSSAGDPRQDINEEDFNALFGEPPADVNGPPPEAPAEQQQQQPPPPADPNAGNPPPPIVDPNAVGPIDPANLGPPVVPNSANPLELVNPSTMPDGTGQGNPSSGSHLGRSCRSRKPTMCPAGRLTPRSCPSPSTRPGRPSPLPPTPTRSTRTSQSVWMRSRGRTLTWASRGSPSSRPTWLPTCSVLP